MVEKSWDLRISKLEFLLKNHRCENVAKKIINFFDDLRKNYPALEIVVEIPFDMYYHFMKDNLKSKNIRNKKKFIVDNFSYLLNHMHEEHMFGRHLSTYTKAIFNIIFDGWNQAIQDQFTATHSENVTNYAVEFANYIKLEKKEREILQYAARAHDIGKIQISKAILNKKEKLTEEEFFEIKRHPEIGASMLECFKAPLMKDVVPVVLEHHENYNGTGYPYGLKGSKINKYARIIRIIDSYDAMIAKRPYGMMMTHLAAIKELQNHSGDFYDPYYTKLFVDYMKGKKKI